MESRFAEAWAVYGAAIGCWGVTGTLVHTVLAERAWRAALSTQHCAQHTHTHKGKIVISVPQHSAQHTQSWILISMLQHCAQHTHKHKGRIVISVPQHSAQHTQSQILISMPQNCAQHTHTHTHTDKHTHKHTHTHTQRRNSYQCASTQRVTPTQGRIATSMSTTLCTARTYTKAE